MVIVIGSRLKRSLKDWDLRSQVIFLEMYSGNYLNYSGLFMVYWVPKVPIKVHGRIKGSFV